MKEERYIEIIGELLDEAERIYFSDKPTSKDMRVYNHIGDAVRALAKAAVTEGFKCSAIWNQLEDEDIEDLENEEDD